jgi:hypothetical protein
VDCYLPYFKQWLITCLLSAIYFCRLCFLKVHTEFSSLPFSPSLVQRLVSHLLLQALFTESSHGDQLLAPLPSLVCSDHPTLSAACTFQFLVYYSVFLWGWGQSVPVMLVYPRGGCGNIACHLFAHLLVCVSQADLELVSGGMGALRFSQCNVVWKSFVCAGGSGCQSFASSWCFFPAKCGSTSEQDF